MKIEFVDDVKEKSILVFPYSELMQLNGGHLFKQIFNNEEGGRINFRQSKECFIITSQNTHGHFACGLDLGVYNGISYEKIRMEYAKTIRDIIPGNYNHIIFIIPEVDGLDGRLIVEALTEGLLLGTYSFDKYKKDKAERNFNIFLYSDIKVEKEKIRESYIEGIERAKLVCEHICLARDLINEPANELNPEKFVSRVQECTDKTRVSVEVLDGNDLQKNNFNGIFSVGKGSEHGPYMAKLKYCAGPQYPSVALVGKGVTMDVGGINLKTNTNISPMRTDMAGAATVLAVVNIISRLNLKINVYGILPMVENMIGSKALRPGEIIIYKNGISVEVTNTDAEGRLILADGILVARELGADVIIDVATLTANMGQALGSKIAGVFGDPALAEEITNTGAVCGEKFWRMPLESEYRKVLQSEIADICNCGSNEPGAITAALFLEEFSKGVKWVHIDMAPTAYSSLDDGYGTKGATGFGIRTLVKLIEEKAKTYN